MTFSTDDRRFMARALELARHGLYTTDPNPRVGCVLVRDGEIVGEGYHARAGEPHAEINALADAGEGARGATCYVTLEPCAKAGRTGPCTEALKAAGVARVVAAMGDPNPAVAGGLEQLRAAGIDSAVGLLESEARALNPGFLKRMESGRPFVRLKLAASLDGRTAMASGESQWITGSAAREDVQRLRARSSAVVTGAGTAVIDKPSLTVRPEQWHLSDYGPEPVRRPLRVVLDRHLRTPVDAPVVSAPGKCLIVTGGNAPAEPRRQLEAAGAEVLALAEPDFLDAVLAELARRECNEVLVECGATLGGALVRAGLVDELVLYMAPTLLGSSARPLLALPEIETMAGQVRLELLESRRLGDDLKLVLRPA